MHRCEILLLNGENPLQKPDQIQNHQILQIIGTGKVRDQDFHAADKFGAVGPME